MNEQPRDEQVNKKNTNVDAGMRRTGVESSPERNIFLCLFFLFVREMELDSWKNWFNDERGAKPENVLPK